MSERQTAAASMRDLHSDRPLIAIVDDDPSIVVGLTMLVDAWGYGVLSAHGMGELEQRLDATNARPALVIADQQLPTGSGLEVVSKVRRRTAAPIPAIILTGDTSTECRAQVEAEGCRILHKPIQVPALRAVIDQLLAV